MVLALVAPYVAIVEDESHPAFEPALTRVLKKKDKESTSTTASGASGSKGADAEATGEGDCVARTRNTGARSKKSQGSARSKGKKDGGEKAGSGEGASDTRAALLKRLAELGGEAGAESEKDSQSAGGE